MLKPLRTLFFAGVCFFSAAAWSAQAHSTDKQTVTLGALFSLSGTNAVLGQSSLKGAQVAVDEINRQGGIKKRVPLKLQVKDAKSSVTVVKAQAKLFVAEKDIQIVFGLNDSDLVFSAAQIIAAAKKAFVSTGGTEARLTDKVLKYLFLAAFSDNTQAAAAAQFVLQQLHIKLAFPAACRGSLRGKFENLRFSCNTRNLSSY